MKVFLVFLFVTGQFFAQTENLETFSWKEDKKLQWSDFRAQPKLGTRAAALSATGIGFGFSMQKTGNKVTSFEAQVDCLFYPTESWYKPKIATTRVLIHEQFHFNITELFARKFRYSISKIKPSSDLRKVLSALYKDISKASLEMQKQYDEETNHSVNKEKQIEWENYITSELNKLEAFKTK